MFVSLDAWFLNIGINLFHVAVDTAFILAITLGKRHGGLTFCRLGRLGFSFYVKRSS
jgi:hypothetical protein